MPRHALLICFTLIITGFIHGTGILAPLRNSLTELRFEAFPLAPTGEIVLAEIDAKSIAALGAWPWSRRVHADLIGALEHLGSSEVAFDVDFSATSNEVDDSAFEAALRNAKGSITLATFDQRPMGATREGSTIVNKPLDRFRAHAWSASVNVQPDPDGEVRRYPFGRIIDGELVPSLASMYGGTPPENRSFIVDFSIEADAVDHISVIDILQGRVEAQRIKGKKVIVGASAIELRDFFQVPNHGLITGALLQAVAAETILQDRALHETGQYTTAGGLIIIGVMVWSLRRFTWRIALAALLFAAATIELFAFALQIWLPYILDTSAWHAAFLLLIVLTTGREIDLRRILLSIANNERHNLKTVLDRVISDSFDGIVIADDRGIIQLVSLSAINILHPHEGRDWRGHHVTELLPQDLALALTNTISACVAGTWQSEAPRELVLQTALAHERVLEYTMTASWLHESQTSDAHLTTDRFVVCLSFRDVTERRLAERRLNYLARFDTLTGLLNRNAFTEHLSNMLGAAEQENCSFSLLYIDLDRFKNINDTFGHGTGDLLLHAVARRALQFFQSPNVLARFGGDEFAALWMETLPPSELASLAQRLISHLSEPYEINGNRLSIGASIGIMVVDETVRDVSLMMRNADTALYRAKKEGGGTYCFYDASMDITLRARQRLEVELRDALIRKEFQVHYQPQFELGSKKLVGVEALLRWRHPERGFVSPMEFIPVAEEVGLMESLGEWVLHQACKEVVEWPESVKVAVNVSPIQFSRGDIVAAVTSALADSGLPANQLELEITESLFMQDNDAVQSCMGRLKVLGMTFALDDFGTGYSSLSYLRKFPIDKIKIDRSFVMGVPNDREAMAIIQAVVTLARNLGIRINAEGLETAEQIETLQFLGCNEGQGFGLGRPQPADQMLKLLKSLQMPLADQPGFGSTGFRDGSDALLAAIP